MTDVDLKAIENGLALSLKGELTAQTFIGEDIPALIAEVRRLWDEVSYMNDQLIAAARARAEEREACAKIAEWAGNVNTGNMSTGLDEDFIFGIKYAAKAIAAAIRTRGEK